jgi:hypothetical protein
VRPAMDRCRHFETRPLVVVGRWRHGDGRSDISDALRGESLRCSSSRQVAGVEDHAGEGVSKTRRSSFIWNSALEEIPGRRRHGVRVFGCAICKRGGSKTSNVPGRVRRESDTSRKRSF